MHEDRNHNITKCTMPSIVGWAVYIIVSTLIMVAGVAWAEDPIRPTTPAITGSAFIKGSTDESNLFDVDASGADIKYVLEALARQSGANIIISPELAGQVNVHVKRQPLNSILDNMAIVLGFTWKQDGSTYLIFSKKKDEQALPVEKDDKDKEEKPLPVEQSMYVWDCRNVRPDELATVVKKLFPSITATEGPSISLPDYVDTGNPASGITPAYNGNEAHPALAINPTSSNTATRHGDKLILMGPAADIEKAKAIITQLDVRKRQISIELAITEITSTGDKQIGMDWNWDSLSVKEGYTQANPDSTDTTLPYNPTNVTIAQPKFLTQPFNFGATLSLMVKSGSAKLLAKPNISVLDGESARIFLGNRVLYLELDSRDKDGKPIYRADSVDAGISLPIAPRIISDNAIMLTLHPSVSLITGYSKIEGSEYPQISTRDVQTTVIVKNGQMLAIGGLLRDEDVKNASKVPIMGDLPVIGSLFRSNTTKKSRTELIIFLSPKIIEE